MREAASRHRYRHAPPDTPPGFWKVGFPGDSEVRAASPPRSLKPSGAQRESLAPSSAVPILEAAECVPACAVLSSARSTSPDNTRPTVFALVGRRTHHQQERVCKLVMSASTTVLECLLM